MYRFKIRNISVSPGNVVILIAGPCVIESEDHCLFMADELQRITQ